MIDTTGVARIVVIQGRKAAENEGERPAPIPNTREPRRDRLNATIPRIQVAASMSRKAAVFIRINMSCMTASGAGKINGEANRCAHINQSMIRTNAEIEPIINLFFVTVFSILAQFRIAGLYHALSILFQRNVEVFGFLHANLEKKVPNLQQSLLDIGDSMYSVAKLDYTTPCAIMAFATFRKPAILAPII